MELLGCITIFLIAILIISLTTGIVIFIFFPQDFCSEISSWLARWKEFLGICKEGTHRTDKTSASQANSSPDSESITKKPDCIGFYCD